MATAGSFTKYRSWSTVESEDPNDIGRLYTPEQLPEQKKLKKTYSTWAFSLIILSLSVVFLVGLLVGYYLKDSQKDECTFGKRSDKFDSEKLYKVHENIMYFISNENVRKLSSDLSLMKDKQTEYVKKEFTSYGLDRVEVHEYEVVVTYPDPGRPNQLVVINSTGQVLSNLTLHQSKTTSKVEKILKNGKRDVKQLQPTVIEGELVFGDYGRKIDLARKTGSLKGKVLMIRQGGNISVKEKISIATAYEVNGILLQDGDTDDTVTDYINCKEKNVELPVLSVSKDTVQVLLSYYINNNRNITIRFTSNYVQMKKLVQNVVGSIIGDIERDRFVVIGASRSQFLPQVGTSYMLELARSFKDMQKINGWIPRRTVKFYSWDHDGITNVGFDQHLKLQNILLETSVVGYIDFDLLHNGTRTANNNEHWLQITGNKIFSEVVKSVVKEIPDPDHTDLVLKDTWHGIIHDTSTHNSRLQQLGVPIFEAAMYPTRNMSQKSDGEHHHMYSLAVSRVASLVTLRLLDDEVLPFNMTNLTISIYNTIVHSVQHIKETQKNKYFLNTEVLLDKAQEFKDAGRTFSEYAKELIQSHDSLAMRRINDAVMKVERIILLKIEYSEQKSPALQKTNQAGHLTSLLDMLSLATVTNDYSDLQCFLNNIAHILQEVIYCLQSI